MDPQDGEHGDLQSPEPPKGAGDADVADPGKVIKDPADPSSADPANPDAQPADASNPNDKSDTGKTWIEIIIIDQPSGKPVPGVPLTITPASGSPSNATTDAQGSVKIQNLDPGACDVTCDSSPGTMDNTYGFLSLSDAAPTPPDNTTPPPDNNAPAAADPDPNADPNAAPAPAAAQSPPTPPPAPGSGPNYIAAITPRQVKTGDTLDAIAAEAPVTVPVLGQFNFGTSDQTQINTHLGDQVGCSKLAPDGVSFLFDDSDHPGILYLPAQWKASLPTAQTHYVLVGRTLRFFVILENEQGFRLPDIDYVITLSDLSKRPGRLGRSGVDAVINPPPGPLAVQYPNTADIKAKSLAVRMHAALKQFDLNEVRKVLAQPPSSVQAAVDMYAVYYNDITGEGMIADIYKAISSDDTTVVIVEALMACAGLKTRSNVTYFDSSPAWWTDNV